jgi:hypothetical protein
MADAPRCACRQKVVLRSGIAAVVRDGIVHRPSHCGQDLELEMVQMLGRIVDGWRAKGVYIADADTGAPKHEPGCTCPACSALRLLVRMEIGGRCVVCGCIETNACQPNGCSWTSEAKVCCDNHPIDIIVEAERLFAEKVAAPGVGHG